MVPQSALDLLISVITLKQKLKPSSKVPKLIYDVTVSLD